MMKRSRRRVLPPPKQTPLSPSEPDEQLAGSLVASGHDCERPGMAGGSSLNRAVDVAASATTGLGDEHGHVSDAANSSPADDVVVPGPASSGLKNGTSSDQEREQPSWARPKRAGSLSVCRKQPVHLGVPETHDPHEAGTYPSNSRRWKLYNGLYGVVLVVTAVTLGITAGRSMPVGYILLEAAVAVLVAPILGPLLMVPIHLWTPKDDFEF